MRVPIVTYETKQRAETIAANIKLNDTRYGSWKAINIGAAMVTVDGVPLAPGEGIEHDLRPDQKWKEPIDIQVEDGGKVRLLRDLVTPKVELIIVEE